MSLSSDEDTNDCGSTGRRRRTSQSRGHPPHIVPSTDPSMTALWGIWEFWVDLSTPPCNPYSFTDSTSSVGTNSETMKLPPSSLQSRLGWLNQVKSIALVDTVEGFWGVFNSIIPPSQLPPGSSYYFFRKCIPPIWEHEANRRGGKWMIRFSSVMVPLVTSLPSPSREELFNQTPKGEKKINDERMKLDISMLKAAQGKGETKHGESENEEKTSNPKEMMDAESVTTALDLGWLKLCLACVGELFPGNEEEICGVSVSRTKLKFNTISVKSDSSLEAESGAALFNMSPTRNGNHSDESSDVVLGVRTESSTRVTPSGSPSRFSASWNAAGEGGWKLSLWTRHAHDATTQIQIGQFMNELLFRKRPENPFLPTHLQETNETPKSKNEKAAGVVPRSSFQESPSLSTRLSSCPSVTSASAKHSSTNFFSAMNSPITSGGECTPGDGNSLFTSHHVSGEASKEEKLHVTSSSSLLFSPSKQHPTLSYFVHKHLMQAKILLSTNVTADGHGMLTPSLFEPLYTL